jgi:hypothetical protein
MNERLIPVASFYLETDSDGDGIAGVYIPQDIRVTHISVFVTLAGSPGTATIDIQDDASDAVAAVDISSNGLKDITDFEAASGSLLELDLNLLEGTSPTAKGEIVLWGHVGE